MSNYIELINDEGKKEKIEILATFHLDEEEYAVLRYPDSEEGMIYRVEKDKGQPVFVMIEDDEELEEVIQIYEGMADDLI
ncbi:Protein of unknown function [Dethiosulfatibacter aminovorans DSM 17477]|uniref:DUF1292 domain-containing protein n=1 Tax=Dethiosulfatibacter aminovorans DSM 17477 TaxID=1121476 RepID=A0A1M6D6G8_9FIRM|nr:DUF1292 domain-containing protein [Dethiosulfatibacter aminovorans]SHI68753.1 Protein of unknown function [Dethiosulfatibacter aminovorans DSM 17477]